MAGLVTLVAQYPDWLIDLVANPVRGIAASCKFFPNLAEFKNWLEERAEREYKHDDLIRRYRPDPERLLAIAGPPLPPQPKRLGALYSDLLELYGIRAIPPGWDAVDLCRAKGRYGANFHAEIEKALGSECEPPPAVPSVYSKMMEQTRAAMRERKREAAE